MNGITKAYRFAAMAAALVLVLGSSVAQAGPITNNIENYAPLQSGWTVAGTITTDGKIGTLSTSDINVWSYTLTIGSTVNSWLSSGYDATTDVAGTGLTATATEITLASPSGSNGRNSLDLGLAGSTANAGELSWDRDGVRTFPFPSPADDGYSGAFNGFNLFGSSADISPGLTLTSSTNWLIAEAPASVPEPGTLVSAVTGTLCLALAAAWKKIRFATAV